MQIDVEVLQPTLKQYKYYIIYMFVLYHIYVCIILQHDCAVVCL